MLSHAPLTVSSCTPSMHDFLTYNVLFQAIVHGIIMMPCTVAFQAAPSAEVQGAQQQGVEEEDNVLFSVDLDARKAGLRAQLAVFAKVRAYCKLQQSCC